MHLPIGSLCPLERGASTGGMTPSTDVEAATAVSVFEEGRVVVTKDRDGQAGGYIVTEPSPRTTLYSMPSSTTASR